MSPWLRTQIDLFKLYWRERAFNKEMEKARKEKDENSFEAWYDNYAHWIWAEYQWERKKIKTADVLWQADDLYLPRPQYNDKTKWEVNDDQYGQPLEGWVLTPEARAELVTTIRKDRKERREEFEWLLKLLPYVLPIITGVGGYLVGVWKHKP